MGNASYLEDITERNIAARVHKEFAAYEEQQIERLRASQLTEETLRRELDSFRRSIVVPLEAIIAKYGQEGPDLGNQLLKLQSEINAASSAMMRILSGVTAADSKRPNLPLADFLTSILNNYRLLLRIIDVISSPLRAGDRSTLARIRASCEEDGLRLKSLPGRLAAREEGIARLYEENQRLKDEIDRARHPGRYARTPDVSWDEIVHDSTIKRAR